jgi:uncharacterized protein YjcR
MGITNEERTTINAMFNAGYTCKEIAEKLGFGESTIRAIVLR